MLKRKYQSGGKPNPKKMNVESGNLSGSDTGNLAYDEGIFVKDEKSGKYLETSKEYVERLIGEGKIDPRNTDQIKYGINNLKRDNAVTKEDRTDFDRFKTSNKLGFNYNESGQLVDRMGRAVDEDYMSNMSNADKRQLGKSYKQAEMNEKTGAGKLIHSIFGSKKKALERGLEGTGDIYGSASNRLAFQVPNYKKEETTPTQQPVTTPDVPVEYKNDYSEGEIKTDKAGYKYKSIKSGGKEYVVYQKPGSNEWQMTEENEGVGDKFNKKGYGQGMEGRQKYLQDFYYGRLNQGTGNRVTSGGGSGTGRNQGLQLGNNPISQPYTKEQQEKDRSTKAQPYGGNNTLSPEYIAQHGFTGSGGKPAISQNQPDWKDYLTYGTVVTGGILGSDQIGKLLKRSQNSLVRGVSRLFKPDVVDVTENPAVERGVSRLAGKQGNILEGRNKSTIKQPQTSPEVQVNTPNITDMSVGKAVKERFNNAMDYISKLPNGQVKQDVQKDYFNMKANGIDENEIMQRINQKYSKELGVSFKKGGLVRKHQLGKKLVEGTKKAGKEALTDTAIGNILDSRKSERDFDMIDAVSMGASFVPGLNVASAAFDAGRNLYDEYQAGDLDSKDFVRNGLDFATNLIPGAKAAKGVFKVTKQLMKPKTAAKVANLSKLIFTN